MKNILVAIDFHEKTKMLVDKAFELAKPFGAKLWLVHVAVPDPDFVGYKIGPQYIRDTRAEELKKEHRILDEYAAYFRENNLKAEGLLIQGATIEMILEESEKLAIDLIITGHHEHSFLYKAFFGSVAADMVRHSKIPVLVVPFGA